MVGRFPLNKLSEFLDHLILGIKFKHGFLSHRYLLKDERLGRVKFRFILINANKANDLTLLHQSPENVC